ncbi:hypothetical protein N9B53_00650 [Mariniblastus sp.]|nr:hypothetical protein [Mariniblastus sp.]
MTCLLKPLTRTTSLSFASIILADVAGGLVVGGVVFAGLGTGVVDLGLLGFGLVGLDLIGFGLIGFGLIGFGLIGRGMPSGDGSGCAHEMIVFWISFHGNSAIRIKHAVTQNAAIMFLVFTNWAGVRVRW